MDDARYQIEDVKAREILDSRGIPTVEVDIEAGGEVFTASVPSGTSKGKREALELRDGGLRYQGMGVSKAVNNVNTLISQKLRFRDVTMQKDIDDLLIKLDGTENKSNLGANALLATSLAVCRAAASVQKKPLWKWISELSRRKPALPDPCILVMEGGSHGKGDLEIQEFMIVPEAKSFKEKLRISTEFYFKLGTILEKKYGRTSANTGLEGAFSPLIEDTEEALDIIAQAAKKLKIKNKVKIILDVAASGFCQKGKYFFEGEILNSEELKNFYLKICKKYPIFAIEDPFNQDDWEGFKELKSVLREKVTIIGDDLLTTNIGRIKEAADKRSCNGLVLKPNQVGTLSEAIEAGKEAISLGWEVFVKHRSGETKDDFISDLACGLGASYIMAGAPTRGERVTKYNRLLKIEEELTKFIA
ncbi:MAG: enolase [Candidatus Pacebacteria bacterium]|nr:enolase [Candidatus Paceibacterota bacterium]